MKHPDREEWAPFIFGEAPPDKRKQLAAHLESCSECADEVSAWRRTLTRLDAWEVPNSPRPKPNFQPALKLALAACLILLAGFVFGRANGSARMNSELRQLHATLVESERNHANALAEAEQRLTASFQSEMQSMWQAVPGLVNSVTDEDRRALAARFQQVADQHATDFVSLRRDLETVASLAQQEIQQANFKLLQVAAAANQ